MPNETPPSLGDVISAALEEVTPGATPENDDANIETPVVDADDSGEGAGTGDDVVDAGAGDDTGAGEGDDPAASGDAGDDSIEVDAADPAAVAAAEADGRVRDPATGRYVKKPVEKAAQTPEEKAAADAAAADKAKKDADKVAADAAKNKKPPDALNDPIPTDVSKKTQERMRTLIDTTRKAEAATTKMTEARDFLLERIMDSTATPQQYETLLGLAKLVNSPDPAEKTKALNYFQRASAALARELGIAIPGVDLLADHADLKQRVDLGQLSRKDAEEMAALRNQQGAQEQNRQRAAAADRDKQQRAADVTNAKAALNTLEQTLKNDPNYAAKSKILIPMMQETFKNIHPSKWAETYQQNYNKLVIAARPRPVPVPNKGTPPANQPLRARTGAGGAAAAPSSLEEAVNAGIAAAG